MIEAYRQNALELLKSPDSPEYLSNQLSLLMATGARNTAHLALARRVAALSQEFVAIFNLASAQNRAGLYGESLEMFRRAMMIAPKDYLGEVRNHVALAHYDLGQFDEAIAFHDETIRLGLANQEIYQNRALTRLAKGELAGLFEFECIHHKPPRKPIAQSGIPRWCGEPLEGKHIIVHHEQGYGDCIQFIRFLPMVRAAKVSFAGPPELLELFRADFTPDEWIGEEGPFEADYYCSLMGAAGAMGIEYSDVSGEPYLTSDVRRLPDRGFKVGLIWRGSSSYVQNANRSMMLEELSPLFEIPGTAFYSLQVDDRGGKDISNLGLDGFIADLSPSLKSWRDTARAIMAMDVVVSVDTACAHLAGALGKPVLILLPYASCWRWMRGTDVTPWYRSARLFRQVVPCDWKAPVAKLQFALEMMM